MKLNDKFDSNLEGIINLCPQLADWFSRNQDDMAYYGFTHKGCLYNNKNMINEDIITLGRMANTSLIWLESPKVIHISNLEKAINAALSIAMVYEEEKEKLSENAKDQYYIDIKELQKEETEEKTSERKI